MAQDKIMKCLELAKSRSILDAVRELDLNDAEISTLTDLIIAHEREDDTLESLTRNSRSRGIKPLLESMDERLGTIEDRFEKMVDYLTEQRDQLARMFDSMCKLIESVCPAAGEDIGPAHPKLGLVEPATVVEFPKGRHSGARAVGARHAVHPTNGTGTRGDEMPRKGA